MEWRNQVAVVTGGSHGIGRATPSRRADTDALRSIVCIFNEDVLRPVKASRRDHGNELRDRAFNRQEALCPGP